MMPPGSIKVFGNLRKAGNHINKRQRFSRGTQCDA